MNRKLVELADKDAIHEEAPPMLFGDHFVKKAKDREDQLRALDKGPHFSPWHNWRDPCNDDDGAES